MPKSNGEFKHEWHLYSLGAIGSSLSLVSIVITENVVAQSLGVALVALCVGLCMASGNWKDMSDSFHKYCICFGAILVLLIIFAAGVRWFTKNRI